MFPVVFRLGPLVIRSYGLAVAAAFLVGLSLAVGEAKRKGIEPRLAMDFGFYALIAGLAGARLYNVAFSGWRYFVEHPGEMLKVWSGGLGVYGGVAAGVFLAIWYTRRNRLDFWRFADVFGPSLVLGISIGRIGCFLNGCCYGLPTGSRLGIMFRECVAVAYRGIPLHPVQLYESGLTLAVFGVLWAVRRRLARDGAVFLLGIVLYALLRFGVEFLRPDDQPVWRWGLHISQLWAAGAAILGVGTICMRVRGRVQAGGRAIQ